LLLQLVDESKDMNPHDTDRYFTEMQIQIKTSTLIEL